MQEQRLLLYLGFWPYTILTFFLLSYRHSVISPLLWCKALTHYLHLNMLFMHISVHTGYN
nr:MAG TPA: hypothetical protein [Caudoviricetes sp.]